MRKKKIFLVDDDELIVMIFATSLRAEGYEVRAETTTDDIVNKIRSWFPDIILLDVNLPGMSGIEILKELKGFRAHIIMLTADDSAETAVKAMKLGAADYVTKPFNMEEVKIVIRNCLEKMRLEQEVEHLRKISCEYFEKEMVGESEMIRDLREKIERLAEARVPSILITGESGTGKEVVARNIHRLMYESECVPRREPFVAVNCAALPEHLLESELFGAERGAFTDAKADRKGVFELANGGTILLDEIGEMNPGLQSKLLRVLEERVVRRIGGKEDMPVEVTVIATTNKNLSQAMKNGEFRNDLFFRLSTFYLHVPPLRERKDDIPLLARYFLSYFCRRYNRKAIQKFSEEAEKCLVSYNWPGNIRELKNVVERLVVLENAAEILPRHLPHWLSAQSPAGNAPLDQYFVLPEGGISLEDLEKSLIVQALTRANHNQTLAAKLLNMSYYALRYQIKKLKLEQEEGEEVEESIK
ncbi:MAG: sigma-54 dependent transcriptional regulator [Alphaproteobacteria bacterium]|uniref:Sigma-54 dependent transcriptional regulator n=1 Tax=Candidatus Nitrobium versatile TaxID=2884831 RepID=A0A953M0T2_9BACT|nr:sigma-54 dependent transcriptional regulator [Candidatus Nitrobium versatile]